MAVRIRVIRDAISPMLNAAPDIYNDRVNRGFRGAGTYFMKVFTQQRLSGRPGIRIYRSSRKKGRTSGRKVVIPQKARTAGFYGRMKNVRRLQGKQVLMGTANRQILTHERGAVITPKKGPFLALKIRRRSDIAAVRLALGLKRGKLPKVIRVRRVVIPARLGFEATFLTQHQAMTGIVQDQVNGATQLLNAGKYGFRRLFSKTKGARSP